MSQWAAIAAASTSGLTSSGHRNLRTPTRELDVRTRPEHRSIELLTHHGTLIATMRGNAVVALRQTMDDALALLRTPEPPWPDAPPGPAPATTPHLQARPRRALHAVGLYRGDLLLHTLSVAGCMQAALDLRYARTLLVPARTSYMLEPAAVPPSVACIA